jgi:hypothetical protein
MVPVAPTRYLDSVFNNGMKTASYKYGLDTPHPVSQFLEYIGTNHPQAERVLPAALPEGSSILQRAGHYVKDIPASVGHFAKGVPEIARYMAVGDPLTAYREVMGNPHAPDAAKGIGTFLKSTYGGFRNPWGAALNIGLPAALTGLAYYSTPEDQRKNIRGQLIGGALGGLIAGPLGGRFGHLGSMTIGVGGQMLGSRIGKMFDPKPVPPEPSPTVPGYSEGRMLPSNLGHYRQRVSNPEMSPTG